VRFNSGRGGVGRQRAPGIARGCAFMAISRHFFARSTLMAAVGDVERRRIWTVTKSADKALAVFRMTTSFKPISAKAWNAFMSFLRSVWDSTQERGAAHQSTTRWKASSGLSSFISFGEFLGFAARDGRRSGINSADQLTHAAPRDPHAAGRVL